MPASCNSWYSSGGSRRMGEVLGRDPHRDAVARLQVVTQLAQGAAIARQQHQAVAVAREQMRQLQADAAGCAGNQGRLRSEEMDCLYSRFSYSGFRVSVQWMKRYANCKCQQAAV